MLRLLLVVLLTSLLGSGALAAGLVTEVPSIVQIVFIVCLGLFVISLATSALTNARADRANPQARIDVNPSLPPPATRGAGADRSIERHAPLGGTAD